MAYNSTRLHSVFFYAVAIAVVAIAVFLVPASAAPQNTTVFRVPNEDISKLAKVNITSRTDYGSFAIIEVPDAEVRKLKAAKTRANEEPSAGEVRLQDHQFNTRKSTPALPAGLKSIETPGQSQFYIVQLKGPTKPEWISEITATGARIISYIPENNYVVWADPSTAQLIDKTSGVSWRDSMHPAYKIAKSLSTAKGKIDYISVVIYDESSQQTIEKITALGGMLIQKTQTRLSNSVPATKAWFSGDAGLVEKIARLPGVLRIEKDSMVSSVDDAVACQIVVGHHTGGATYTTPTYPDWLSSVGYDGTGSIVAVLDTGCDTNDETTMHQDLQGRIQSIIGYTPLTDLVGHGTHVAGIIAGTAVIGTTDSNGYPYGQGMAPGSKLVIQNAVLGQFPPSGDWGILTKDALDAGAFVSNNSWFWISEPGVGYTPMCAEFDALVRDGDRTTEGLQPLTMVFSVGNGGPDENTVYQPKEAKNIITVGASENYRPLQVLGLSCGATSDINGVADFSSRGPCLDGRLAPTIVAPGTSVASAASYSAAAIGSYNDPFDPCKRLIDDDYALMSGTSQAAPLVSGAVALIGQWWRTWHNGANPSPAMTKAILVNSADDMYGGSDGRGGTLSHIPNNSQGWGRLNVDAAINPANTYYDDQTWLLTATGQSRRYRIQAADPSKPIRITLVWTDAPGTPGANAWVNDLDLSVTGSAGTYLGNHFSNGWSTTGPTRDSINNVECVYIQNPSGTYTVTVTAANIAGDGVPGNDQMLDQDYALVIRNAMVGGEQLSTYVSSNKGGPALPDYYQVNVDGSGWCAVGVRSSSGSDHDISLYNDPGYYGLLTTSSIRGSGIDLIAIDGNSTPLSTLYPKVTAYNGKTGYRIEWATHTTDLIPGVTNSQSFSDSNILRVWDVSVSDPSNCVIRVTPTAGLDIGVAVFGSNVGIPATWYKGRVESLGEADSANAGSAETLSVTLPVAGRYGAVVWNKGGTGDVSILLDTSPPTTPVVTTPAAYTTDFTKLSASWTASDPETGIVMYEYAIGRSLGATDVVGWTNVGTSTYVVHTGLTLSSGENYYISVQATNALGQKSLVGTSAPVMACNAVADIAAAKLLPSGKGVVLTQKHVSAVFAGTFYIEEAERFSGIGVQWPGSVTEGVRVTVAGRLVTSANERFIDAVSVTP